MKPYVQKQDNASVFSTNKIFRCENNNNEWTYKFYTLYYFCPASISKGGLG